ncbi:MAG: hypothetical protein Kow0013_24310 [Pararhodobacter sp.]
MVAPAAVLAAARLGVWAGGRHWALALAGLALIRAALMRGGLVLNRPARCKKMCDFSARG